MSKGNADVVMKYEEIIHNNSSYTKINDDILSIDRRLKQTLSPEQYKVFMEYEKQQANLEYCVCDILYSHFA